MPSIPDKEIQDLYRLTDEAVQRLTVLHADRLHCGPGCCSCCVDDITIFVVEARNIEDRYRVLLAESAPHAPDSCAFLDDRGHCRIYEHRPYVCRTQGLPIRWMDEDDDGDPVEMRDICPLNEKGTPVEELPEDACWTIGPVEEKLAALQYRAGKGKMERIALRDLFRKK